LNAQINEEDLIKILVEYVWQNKDKMFASTPYEKSILLLNELRDKTLAIIYKRWKEEMKNEKGNIQNCTSN